MEPPQPPQEPSTEPVSDSVTPPVTESVSAEPPKRVCIHCKEEIPPESIYCDRCGRYLGKPAARS